MEMTVCLRNVSSIIYIKGENVERGIKMPGMHKDLNFCVVLFDNSLENCMLTEAPLFISKCYQLSNTPTYSTSIYILISENNNEMGVVHTYALFSC